MWKISVFFKKKKGANSWYQVKLIKPMKKYPEINEDLTQETVIKDTILAHSENIKCKGTIYGY